MKYLRLSFEITHSTGAFIYEKANGKSHLKVRKISEEKNTVYNMMLQNSVARKLQFCIAFYFCMLQDCFAA